jgi:hypothetical protein
MKALKTTFFALGYCVLFVIMATLANYASRHYYEDKNLLDFFAAGWPMTWLICSLPFFILLAALVKAPHPRTIGIVSTILCLFCAVEILFHYHGLATGGLFPLIAYVLLGFQSLKMAIGNTIEHLIDKNA